MVEVREERSDDDPQLDRSQLGGQLGCGSHVPWTGLRSVTTAKYEILCGTSTGRSVVFTHAWRSFLLKSLRRQRSLGAFPLPTSR